MNTIVIILSILVVVGIALFLGMKFGKIKDSDGDFIPDAVEDTAAEVKRRAKNVKKSSKTLAVLSKKSVIKSAMLVVQ